MAGTGLAPRAAPLLDTFDTLSLIVHTGEGGACDAVSAWARMRSVPVLVVPFVPKWSKDPAAFDLYPLRLLTDPRPDVVVVFPSALTARTHPASLVQRAQAFAIPCLFAAAI